MCRDFSRAVKFIHADNLYLLAIWIKACKPEIPTEPTYVGFARSAVCKTCSILLSRLNTSQSISRLAATSLQKTSCLHRPESTYSPKCRPDAFQMQAATSINDCSLLCCGSCITSRNYVTTAQSFFPARTERLALGFREQWNAKHG